MERSQVPEGIAGALLPSLLALTDVAATETWLARVLELSACVGALSRPALMKPVSAYSCWGSVRGEQG